MKKIISIITICSLFLSLPLFVGATSTKDKLNQAQEDKKKSEEELKDHKDNLTDLRDEKNDLQSNLNSLNKDLGEISDNLQVLENQIQQKREEIEKALADLAIAKGIEQEQYANMKKRIQFMYERQDFAYLEILFGAESFGDFLNRTEYIEKLSEYDRRMLTEYQKTREEITEYEANLQNDKKELDEKQLEVENEKKRVAAMVSKTSNNIAGYADQITAAELTAIAKEEEIRLQEANITALKKKLAEEMALSNLAANSKWRDISEVTFDEGDRYLLANLIYCEAGGEPYSGQVAVGAVVINRLLSSVYPDTIVGVIYQNKQFSPVASGRLALALANNRATAACYQAADEAMKGMTNVENCLYFRTPIDGVNPRYVIGGHIFY